MLATPEAKKGLFLASSLCDGVEDNNMQQVTTLLDSKEADPNVIIPVYGITPFHLAIGNSSEAFAEEVTKLFLRHGGNPNIRSNEGLTPVHVAAAWGRCKVLELLLANGGDPLLLDNEGYSPFHFAFDGVHYDAVNILRKYCNDSFDEEEEIKYGITLEKLFINNKNVIAEYVVSDEQTPSTLNISHENVLELNIKSKDGSSTRSSQVIFNENFVTLRKSYKNILKMKKESEKTPEKINSVNFEVKIEKEEKHLVSGIIDSLSTSFSSDVAKSYATNNSDASLYEKRMRLLPKMTIPQNCRGKLKTPTKVTSSYRKNIPIKDECGLTIYTESPPNTNRGRLKYHSREEKTPVKAASTQKAEQLRTKSSFYRSDSAYAAVDHSIISKSPNCNIISRFERKKFLEKSPITRRQILKSLDNSIISKSPNCNIRSTPERKRNLAKLPSFKEGISPKVVKKPLLKMVLQTPCKTKSNVCNTNSQSIAQVSKSLPKNFYNACAKTSNRKIFSHFKKPMSVDRKVKSSMKSKETEDSSGVYSSSSKMSYLKDVAVKLENYFPGDFDSLSNNNDVQSTRLSEGNEHRISTSVTDAENKGLSTSLENGMSQLNNESIPSCDFKDKILNEKIAKVENVKITYLKSRASDYTLGCESDKKSYLSDDSLQSFGLEPRDEKEVEKIENSLREDKKESFMTDDLTDKSFLNILGIESFVSIEEEYRYKDPEKGVILMERRLCITPSCIPINKEEFTSFYTCSTAESVSSLPQEMLLIDKKILRQRLTDLGETPGPITNSTYRVYLKRLMKLEDKKQIFNNVPLSLENPTGLSEKKSIKSSLLSLDWQKDLETYRAWENKVFQEFARPDPSRRWREGLTKASFNYLLLDSRITKDLPNRSTNLHLQQKWQTFLSAIFYVGKGKRSRPYAHLYDAFHTWVSKEPVDVSNKKIKQILEIWNEKQGVVVLHVFHNTIPVEAYTREAAMIDALGLDNLGNCKGGEYYGTVATWTRNEKCELGKYLLYKAMEILMVEGERHLFPEHL